MYYSNKPSKFKVLQIISKEKNQYTSKKNIVNFLENKFLENNKKFKEYKKPIIIEYEYNGLKYRIYMKYLSFINNKKLIKGPGCMEAYIFEKRKRVIITKKFLEIYGHTKNFYSHVAGCYNGMLFMSMKEYTKKYIHIINEYGKKNKYYITLGKKIIIFNK